MRKGRTMKKNSMRVLLVAMAFTILSTCLPTLAAPSAKLTTADFEGQQWLIDEVLKQTKKTTVSDVTTDDLKGITSINLHVLQKGQIPAIIGEFTGLTELSLFDVDGTTIPKEIGNLIDLKKLEIINADDSTIQGQIRSEERR